jgi:hypothetical protein
MIRNIFPSPLRAALDTAPDAQIGPEPHACGCALAPEDGRGQAYNEEAFRYFVALERKHSERSGRSFLLVLVDLQGHSGGSAWIAPPLARKLFLGLSHCVGETDFMGWYRHGHVLGAVLLACADQSWTDVLSQVPNRTMSILRNHIPPATARSLRVRAHHESAPEGSDSGVPQVGAELVSGDI